MAIVDKVKSFLRGATPAARLAEIEAASATAAAERAQHLERRPAEVVAKLTGGDPDAATRVELIDQAVAALDARLHDLRDAAQELRRRIAADEAAARKRAIEARPKRIAELRRQYMAEVEQISAHAEGMAAALLALSKRADALAAEVGDENAARFLAFGPRLHRMQSGLARLFVIDPKKSLVPGNSLIGMVSHEVGARSHWTTLEQERTGLDDLAPFFDSQAEAAAARDRLAARGSKVIVLPLPGGCFTLVSAESVFGDRTAADKAARTAATRGKPVAIVGYEGGFVLIPERFVGEAA